MNNRHKIRAFFSLILMLGLAGCAKNFVITTDLASEMPSPCVVQVGDILDELPPDLDADHRPSAEDVEKLKDYLRDEVEKRGDLNFSSTTADDGDFEIRGSLIDYKKGSGMLRFFIGFGAGAARVTVSLELVDKTNGDVIFAGNFFGQVSDGLVSGEDMFRMVARDFTKELEKQIEARMGA